MLFDDSIYLTVSEINSQVREVIERNYGLVQVLGEISNLKRHTSGHVYFTLKDSGAQLRAVCFRGDAQRLRFEPEDGLQVIATGRLTVYEPYGQYQLVASALDPFGAGELERAFRALQERLDREGLFDAVHKKPLPAYPVRIAVVTSPTGAAVRDVVSTLQRRWPCAEILLVPVRVQGDLAAQEIVHALNLLGEREDVDIIILGRGGGSLEDLWAFNEEPVARAIFACPIPVISAVGHETDFTISDYVADVRAATPTMAAEIATPNWPEVAGNLEAIRRRMARQMGATLERRSSQLRELLRSYALRSVVSRIDSAMQRHDSIVDRLARFARDTLRERRQVLRQMVLRLDGLNPKSVLARGYAICSTLESGKVVASSGAAIQAGLLRVTFSDGSVKATVGGRIDGQQEK